METKTQKTGQKIGKGLQGKILSHKMDKTAVVLVSTYKKHPKYGKFIVHDKKFKAHDEKNEYAAGDVVRMMPCRPMSKEKRFTIVEKIR
ncbi:MAG: 30S ribosomal protein S17 [Candidatus Paceibacterota bacterium]|jgi:small subunit ribosomal protein S17